MNIKPEVSVIIPTYNRGYLVGRSIESVLNQTYHNFELIIVDDASTDNTKEVIKKYQKVDSRIIYLNHDKNKGGSAARNTGIKAAKGKYFAFQDSDDEWLPEKLEKQMKYFEKSPSVIGVVYTGFWRIKNDEKRYIPSDKIMNKDSRIHNELLRSNFIGTPTILINKDCLKDVGYFDETLPRLQDWELVLRLSKKYIFKFIDEPLVVSYYTDDSISANNNLYYEALEMILNKHSDFFLKRKNAFALHYFNLGYYYCLNNDFNKGKKYLFKSFFIYPKKIKYLAYSIISLFGQNNFRKFLGSFRKIKSIILNR